jgi:hypothetical protein
MIAGALAVIALGAIVYHLLIQDPPVPAGQRTKTDLRSVYAGVWAVGALAAVAWAPFKTRAYRSLATRGNITRVTDVSVSLLRKNGMQPVRVTYVVDGQQYTVATDMLAAEASEIRNNVSAARVVYDEAKPSNAVVLSPSMARLPERDPA